MTANDWVLLIERLGFPIAAFLLLFFSCRSGLRWYANKVLEPKAKADVALLDSVRDTNDKHAENQAKLVESQIQLANAQVLQTELMRDIVRGQESLSELLKAIAGKHIECPMRDNTQPGES